MKLEKEKKTSGLQLKLNKRGRRSSKRHAFKGRRRSNKLRSELSKNAFAVSKRSKRRGKE